MHSFKNIYPFIALCVVTLACKQQVVNQGTVSDFAVMADSSKTPADTAYYTLGAKSTFNFSGNPFTISFFSGELGHKYIYRNRTSAQGIAKFIFTNALNVGTQQNTLHVMLSTDFKGVVAGDTTTTIANITAASWKDITPAVLANNATAVTDTIDLTSYASAGKAVFIAFKYTAQSGSVQNKWTITNVNLTNSLSDNTVYTIANLNTPSTAIINYGTNTYSPGWVAYTPSNTKKWTVSTSSLIIDSTNAASTINSESWAIMGSIDLTKVSPDMGVSVKGISSLPAAYQYLYTAKGNYTAAFLATNNTQFSTDSVVRTIPIVIR
ncbi:MAG: DUF5017 domain-containing protein [Sphingobacteriia bacterium]|nr:DUF5017 domain-containing protein [Sphingobacteriia bacterium]